ncbi:TIR domain-containing protein [Nonlabens sp. Asnod2-A12]|uniref:TIR domain-containing protein n=1 Tax=Nonlabens sp. Asnod2-A12 TaxID=3160578 RepID=UPI00386503FA
MKVFISWSGNRSRQVAELLNNWLECVLQAADPWMSSKDIDRGALWFSEITDQLATTKIGIVCLTKANLNKPWILFESGALAKGLSSNKVCTFLIDLEPNDISDPLAQFNHTFPDKEGLYQLARTLNNSLDNSLRESILQNVFDTYWSQFEKDFKTIMKSTSDEEVKIERTENEVLGDVLSTIRNVDRRLRRIETESDHSSSNNDTRKRRGNNYISQEEAHNRIKMLISAGLDDDEILKSLKEKVPAYWMKKKLGDIREDIERE